MKIINTQKIIIFTLVQIIISVSITNAQEQWSLKRCIDSAMVYNKTLQINRNNSLASKERESEAKYNLLPKINANADYKYFTELPHQLMPLSTFNPQIPEGQFREVQFGVPHNINASLVLSLPLYNPNIYGAINITQIASEIMDLQYQKSQEQLIFDISTLYYNLKILYSQLQFIDSNLINTNKLLNNITLLREQLLAKGSDVNKLKLLIEQLSTQRENIEIKYKNALNLLKLTMGVSLDHNIEIESDIHYNSSENYIVKSKLDIQLLNAQNKLLRSELNTIQYSRFLPSINIIASYGTTGFGYDKKPNDFLDFYSVSFAGIQFSYPLFDGLISQKKINQKEVEISNNNLQSQLISDKIDIDIENAKRQRNIAMTTITNIQNQIELAKDIYYQSILQHKEGIASLTDVLLADNALRETQQNYIVAVIDYLKSDLELMKITGNILKISE